jgi:hypothetical protein
MIPTLPISSENQLKVIRGLLIAGGLYVGYRITSKAIKSKRERQTSALADERAEVRQAMGLRSAMNPSGISWLMWSDGTNEDAIAQIASQIQDLDTVATAYRNLYSDDLLKDLQSELSTTLFNSFLQTVSNNRINTQSGNPSGQSSTGAYTAPQRLVVAKQSVYVRTSPDASYHGAWYEVGENKNIFKTAKAGEFIGYATGKQHYDSKNNVKFIEVAYKIGPLAPASLQSQIGVTRLLWISASATYTDQFSSVASMEARYPATKGVTKYYLPISGLGWLSAPGSRVVTIASTRVMDEQFQTIGHVKSGVLMGYPVMSLDGHNAHFTLVRTLEGHDRWLASKDIQTQ